MTMLSLVPLHCAAVVAAARTSSDGRGVRARFRCWLAMRFSLNVSPDVTVTLIGG